jgi:hypothetical protein
MRGRCRLRDSRGPLRRSPARRRALCPHLLLACLDSGRQRHPVDDHRRPRHRHQRAALVALDGAKHGGRYFEIFASVCPNLLEAIFAPLEITINHGKQRAQVIIPDVLETRVEPIISPVSGEPYRARIVLPDGFEFKKAEMGNAVRFEVKTPGEVAMRHENSYAPLNAFDWSN